MKVVMGNWLHWYC